MTRRALLIGLGMAAWVTLWPAYSSLILHSSRADYAHLSVALLIPFICLLLINTRLDRKGRGLTPSELLAVCCIGMVAATTQGEWLSGYFLGVITAPAYFASPENRWGDLILDQVPRWSIVADRAATTGFYEGLPPGAAFPWIAWLPPLFWWTGFLASVLLVSFCLVMILRRQWMEHERLAFPIASVVLELTGVSGTRGTLSNLLRSRQFRIGFFLVLAIFCWNILAWFLEALPPLKLPMTVHNRQIIQIGKGFPYFAFTMHPMTMAFGYFTKSDVLLSVWLFHLLAILQVGLMNRVGFSIGSSDMWCSFHPAIGWQSFGGMAVFAGWGLWIARGHLGAVYRMAFRGSRELDDSGELISYRMAGRLLVGGAAFLILWLWQAGMGWAGLLAFWFATLVLYLGLARIIAETGMVYLRGPISAQAFAWHALGIDGLGPSGAIGLALTYTFFCDGKTFGITTMSHIPRLGEAMGRDRRKRLVSSVMLGAGVGAAVVIAYILYQAYWVMGSYNFGVVSFNGSNDGGVGIWRFTANRMQQGSMAVSWDRLAFMGVGGLFTALLFYLRYRFPGFPVHPIGFAISASNVLRSSAASIFLIWLIKSLLFRFGGLDRYRRTAPLFLGLLVGYLAGVALGILVDAVWFPGDGHPLNDW